MICRKCRGEIPDGSKFCNLCGVKQSVEQNPKNRGNGTGSVYKLKNGTWIAIRVLGYHADEDGKLHKRTLSKSGFKTKRDAVNYLPLLRTEKEKRPTTATFAQVYEAWLPTHKATKSTLDCYRAAYKYFSPVYTQTISDITVDDLQECLDECPKGKRTRQNMRTLCGLLYKYAIPRHLATLNMGQYLRVYAEAGEGKDALPDEAVAAIAANVGTVPGADYVLCQCYLGFRPSELLALDVENYNQAERAFIGGAKTEAGKNRIVTVSPKIQPIIDRLLTDPETGAVKETGPVFRAADGSRLSLRAYRTMFYSVLDACGIENPVKERDGMKWRKYTPHSCRHTFATLMKRVAGNDKDKLELIGHSSVEMLHYYQSASYADLRKITDAL